MTALEGSNGDVMYFTTSAAYAKGDFYAKGGYAGICLDDAKSGEKVAVQMSGVFEDVPKTAATVVINNGDKLYCVDNANSVNKTAANRIAVGYALGGSANGVTGVDVLLALGA